MGKKQIDLEKLTIPEDYCDCRFFSFRVLLSRYGFLPSDAEMLGLGEGLSFQLMNVSSLNTKIYCPIGKDMNFEPAYGKQAGIGIRACTFESGGFDDVIGQVKRKIDEDNPVVVNADRYYLEYMNIKRAHVGYHTVTVIGYDDEKQAFQLLDGLTGPKVISLSYGLFHKAVVSDCVLSTGRRWYCVAQPARAAVKNPGADAVAGALRNTCLRVLHELESARGFVTAMKKYADQSAASPQIGKYLDVQSNVFFPTFYEQDRTRTFYRKTFLDFLNEHLDLFPPFFRRKIPAAGERLLMAIRNVHEAREVSTALGLLAFDAYIEKERALHNALLFGLNAEKESLP